MMTASACCSAPTLHEPEQAKGKPADKRPTLGIWVVLFEMLSGNRAFEGEDVSDTLAAVLRGQTDWKALPPDVLGRSVRGNSAAREDPARIPTSRS